MASRNPHRRFRPSVRTMNCASAGACVILCAVFLMAGLPLPAALEASASLAVCALHAADKAAAASGLWRIPEKTLLSLTLASGGAAPFVFRHIIRHKTAREHGYFTLCEAAAFCLHAALLWYCGIISL